MTTTNYRNVHGVTVFCVETEDDADSSRAPKNAKTMLDLNQIRQSLEQKLERRVARAEKIDDRLRQPGDEDWQEQAMQREDDEVLESLGTQAVREIGQIKQALHRIDNGTYGVLRTLWKTNRVGTARVASVRHKLRAMCLMRINRQNGFGRRDD